MQTVTISKTPTAHFLGRCTPCVRPIRVTLPDQDKHTLTTPCPECSKGVLVRRLAAVVSADFCDGACMSAVGPDCSCSCSGENHGASWGGSPKRWATTEFMEALDEYRAKTAKTDARRAERKAARAQAESKAALDYFNAWLGDLTDTEREIIQHVRASYDNVGHSDFLTDMRSQMIGDDLRPLSDRQLKATVKWVTGDRERAARAAADAVNAKPVPTGRLAVEGEIVSWRSQDGYQGRPSYKMLVKCDGWKVWGSVPGNIADGVFRYIDPDKPKPPNLRVRFTATLEPSKDDPSFGFFTRPVKAELLDPAPVS